MAELSLAALKRQRTRRLTKLIVKSMYLYQRGRDEEVANQVCNEFVSLGGVYIKFLQGVLLSSPIMKKWHSPNRLKIFENLDTEPLDVVGILRDELDAEQLAQIKLIQPAPFAAGSFGQVYYGQHVNGKAIIIKVLRPKIRELLKHDLRLLGIFGKGLIGREYPNISMKLNDALKEFRAATMRETDYISEALFAREMYETFQNHPTLVIPETYLDLSTEHLIVQDYVDGISAVELVRLRQEGGDPKSYVAKKLGSNLDAQLETLGVEMLNGMFTMQRIQGDPHPGNIRLLRDDKIGIIDFGISAHAPDHKAAFFGIINEWHRLYSDTNTADIANLFEQFMRFFVNDLYKALKKVSSLATAGRATIDLGAGIGVASSNSLVKDIGKMVQDIFSSAVGTHDVRDIIDDGRMMQVFNQMVNKGNRFGLVVKLNASEVLRAAQTYMTLVETLGRRKVVFPRVFQRVVLRVEHEHPELLQQADEPVSISEAVETIHSWLERVAARDPALFRQLIAHINARNQDNPKEKISHA